jgi:hypothetical protein
MSRPLSRRTFNALLLSAGATGVLPRSLFAQTSPQFAHPGLLHSGTDLDRMRKAVQQRFQPIYAGFEKLRDHPGSKPDYKSSGAAQEIGRNPNIRFGEFDNDANAAYQCALMSCITRDPSFARVSITILNAWASTLRKITGADAILCASLGGFKLVNAAELIRHTGIGWLSDEMQCFERMMTEIFLPVIINFSPFANGNWDTAAIKLMLSIAVYTDDRALFDRAINYYLHGCGDGRLDHYIYSNGQCQESGRDQQHTQLGIMHQGDCCEIAWHQKLDLYSALDNRLLRGFEYAARYGLGESVSFVPDVDQTGKYRHSVISPRSSLRPGYEQIYNHYVQRRGIAAPWTQRAAEKLRPEGAPFQSDATGFGTLLYTRPPGSDIAEVPDLAASPVLYARASNNAVNLSLLPLAKTGAYTITRAEYQQGPYRTIASDVSQTMWRDTSGETAKLYFYRAGLSATRQFCAPVAQMVALPEGWRQQNRGEVEVAGAASFDGTAFTLSAGGAQSVEKGGSYFFLYRSLPSGSVFTARLQPLIASQLLSVGIAACSAEDHTRFETFLLVSPRGGPSERPVWAASLIRRSSGLTDADPSQRVTTIASQPLVASTITYGRLVFPLWLRIEYASELLRAFISSDGIAWSKVAKLEPPSSSLDGGIFLASGIEGVATEVVFDHVSLTTS